jgi:uncharacterized membrane protein
MSADRFVFNLFVAAAMVWGAFCYSTNGWPGVALAVLGWWVGLALYLALRGRRSA